MIEYADNPMLGDKTKARELLTRAFVWRLFHGDDESVFHGDCRIPSVKLRIVRTFDVFTTVL